MPSINLKPLLSNFADASPDVNELSRAGSPSPNTTTLSPFDHVKPKLESPHVKLLVSMRSLGCSTVAYTPSPLTSGAISISSLSHALMTDIAATRAINCFFIFRINLR